MVLHTISNRKPFRAAWLHKLSLFLVLVGVVVAATAAADVVVTVIGCWFCRWENVGRTAYKNFAKRKIAVNLEFSIKIPGTKLSNFMQFQTGQYSSPHYTPKKEKT